MRWLAYGTSIAALAWVVMLWWDDLPKVIERLANGNAWHLLGGLSLALGSGYANFLAFLVLARAIVSNSLGVRDLSHLYFVSQLLKHLPGRVWGIGYQVAMDRREGAAANWLFTNLAHMAAATCVALAMAASIVAWGKAPAMSVAIAVAGFATFVLAWPSIRWLVTRLAGSRGWRGRIKEVVTSGRLEPSTMAWVLLALLTAGVMQYGSWILYSGVIGLGDMHGALVLCALYMLAWFVGYISFLTPSGIGVRELVFIGISTGFESEAVAAMAVVGRMSFLIVDVLLSLPFLLRQPGR